MKTGLLRFGDSRIDAKGNKPSLIRTLSNIPVKSLVNKINTLRSSSYQSTPKKNEMAHQHHHRRENPAIPSSAATASEQADREHEGYTAMESSLSSSISSRSQISLTDNISSYLGARNPLAKEVDPETSTVWLLDNTAYRPVHAYPHQPQPWQAEFVAAYFVKDSGKDISSWVADIADKIGLGASPGEGISREEGEMIIAERFKPFVSTIQPARWLDVKFPTGELQKLGPGGRNAISSQIELVPGNYSNGDIIEVNATPAELAPAGHMRTHFAEPEGWMVISDIDDSIKITMTPSPIGVLRSTFVDTPTPIAGMPELYAHINQLLSPTWFYLSASPYNLYTFLRPFLHKYYPSGTTILRDASWMDFAGFLRSYTVNTQDYKASRIEKIHDWLPKRKVLCVGDSTQSDPEAYGELYRKTGPAWIQKIFIRRVTGISEFNEHEKNQPERFEKAFEGVPKDVWSIFDGPEELYDAVNALKAL